MRGNVPAQPPQGAGVATFSPHTRECSQDLNFAFYIGIVFPHPAALSFPRRYFPRANGDIFVFTADRLAT